MSLHFDNFLLATLVLWLSCFSTILLNRSICSPWEGWHDGSEGMNAVTWKLRHLLSVAKLLDHNCSMLMQRTLRASLGVGLRRLLLHICVRLLLFHIWWCPWQHGGSHEVCSHVLCLVTSVISMFKTWIRWIVMVILWLLKWLWTKLTMEIMKPLHFQSLKRI